MSKFKDASGRYVTVGIFQETAGPNKEFIAMTLDEGRQRFVECGDMLGIEFADVYLDGYQHWKAIQNSARLDPIIAEWKEELEVRIRSEELKRIAGIAKEGHFQASKFLADRGWETRKAGKPSKSEVERETKVQTRIHDEFAADVLRFKKD